jgi:hypothetical protein
MKRTPRLKPTEFTGGENAIPQGGSNSAHSRLIDAILRSAGALPFVRIWKRHVGLFYIVRKDRTTGKVVYAQPIDIGIEGEPDLDGILTRWDGVGVRVGIECKTGQAGQNDDQKRYQKMITTRGGIYILARTVEETLSLLERERVRGKPDHVEAAATQAQEGGLPLLRESTEGPEERQAGLWPDLPK